MKIFLVLFATVVGPVGLAYADISDSGNLTIGNQAVIQGTMTVTGQNASGYSISSSSGVSTGGCIQFGDSSTQCSASSGGPWATSGSNAYVTNYSVGIGTSTPATTLDVNGSAQFGSGATKSTFTATGSLSLSNNASLTLSGSSGNIVNTSSVTASAFFGDGSHLTGVNTSSLVSETFVSSQDVVNVTTVTFNSAQGSVFVSSTPYNLIFYVQNSSSSATSICYLIINGDTEENYAWYSTLSYSGENNEATDTFSSAYGWELGSTDSGDWGLANGVKGVAMGNLTFGSMYGSFAPSTVFLLGGYSYENTSDPSYPVSGYTVTGGSYTGSATISSINIICGSNSPNSAQTHNRAVTGHFELWKGLQHK